MGNHCYNIVFNPDLAKTLPVENHETESNLFNSNDRRKFAESCFEALKNDENLKGKFIKFVDEQLGRIINQVNLNYIINSDQVNSDSIIYHSINPSLFEVTASKIAYYLFPDNFANFKFITKPDMDPTDDIDAGYIPSTNESTECEGKLEGIENVYAAAFYLGLEVRSYRCIKTGEKTNLFINDFSHPFHKVDLQRGALIDEFRDHKIIPFEKGTLFPTSFLNQACGQWINSQCDVQELKKAYERIITVSQEDIKNIISTTITVLQSIECMDSQDSDCKDESYYKVMETQQDILESNYESIKTLYALNSEPNLNIE